MKLASLLRLLALLAFLPRGEILAAPFDMSVTPSTTSVSTGGQLTYTGAVTNNTGVTVFNAHIASQFPSTFTVLQATNNLPVSPLFPGANQILTNSGSVDFQIDTFAAFQVVLFTLKLAVNPAGTFTNTFTVTGQGLSSSLSIVTAAGTGSGGQADLKVALSGVPNAIISADAFKYTITVSNLGPNSATGVIVQNTVPTGAIVAAVSSPTTVTRSGDILTWQVGSLTNGAAQTLDVTLQPTNVVNNAISASVQAPNNVDSGGANNSATNEISVQPIVTSALFLTRGTQTFNRQTALFEETVNVLNVGGITLPTVRVLVENMVAPDGLFNVTGTNGVSPFVASTAGLAPGSSTNILLQFFSHDRTFKTNLTLVAMRGPIPGLSTNDPGTNGFKLAALRANGLNFLSFPTTLGSNYSVVASQDISFTNSIPISVNSSNLSTSLVATATLTVLTNSSPFTNGNVFFRAVQNP